MSQNVNPYTDIIDFGDCLKSFCTKENFHKDGVCIVAHFDIAKKIFDWIIKNMDVELDSIELVNPEISGYDGEFLITLIDGELSVEMCKRNGKYLRVCNSFVFVSEDVAQEWINLNLDPELDNILSFFSIYKYPSEDVNETTLDTLLESYCIDYDTEYNAPYHSFSIITKDGATFSYHTNKELPANEISEIVSAMI